MKVRTRRAMFAGAALASLGLAGCGAGAHESIEDTGSLEVKLTAAPSDAACLRVSVVGSRTTTKTFDLSPGVSTTISLDRLPVGIVQVDATAFAQTCSTVSATTVPNWVSEKPASVLIDPLDIVKVLLKLIRNGQAEIGIDFEPPPWLSSSKAPVDIAIIGDTPYGAAQIDDFPRLLRAINDDARIAEVIHVGDIKNGSSRCDDSYYQTIFTNLSTLVRPLIYTPGDNEWTDCHRANNGAYDPLERLDAIRKLFFPVPGLALAGGFKQVLAQSTFPGFQKFVENQIWFESSVAFGAVHVVGSNDSKIPWYTDNTTGTKVDDPARRDAERNERQAATLDWLNRLFELARGQSAAGVVIAMQADMFDPVATLDAFDVIVQRIAALTLAFGKPVLLVNGDSHVFTADNPLAAGNLQHGVVTPVANFTRITVQGSTTTPLTEWLRLHVDPATSGVFTWERNAR